MKKDIHPPVNPRYAVVSVRLERADFDAIAEQAQREGKKMSTFIREAAVNATTNRAQVISVSGPVQVYGLPRLTQTG